MNKLTILYSLYYSNNDIDTEFLNEYFKIYINFRYKDKYNEINIQYTPQIVIDPKKDIIQTGFDMLKVLNKLKTPTTDYILMYIANGTICHKQLIYNNVDILLFQNNSSNIKYTANTNTCNVLKTDDKLVKLGKVKIFRITLDDLFDKKYNILYI